MEFTGEELLQLLETLQVTEETEAALRELMTKDDYRGVYRYLRSIRSGFLEDLHLSQKRLDLLDLLIYEIKKRK